MSGFRAGGGVVEVGTVDEYAKIGSGYWSTTTVLLT